MRSRTGQMQQQIKARKRIHQSIICPIACCGKAIKRPHNHLKQTHKITDPVLYQRLLSKISSQNGI